MSPRTIEVLMNTYSVMQLPEEAVDLVPPETLQVRFQDTVARPAPQNSYLLKGSPVYPHHPTLPHRDYPETLSCPRGKRTEWTPQTDTLPAPESPEDTHWPPASPCGCHFPKAASLSPSFYPQKHQRFYSSLFALARQPRSLQHLSRCALRTHLEGCLPYALPRLPLPPRLLRYLQLDFEDMLY